MAGRKASAPVPPGGKRLVLAAVAVLGMGSVMTQLALMRELLGSFGGNELLLGIVLGNWLLLTGIGAGLGRLAQRWKTPGRALPWLQILVALVPLAQIILVRVLRNPVFGRGIAIGVSEAIVASFIVLLPFCLLSGFFLSLACAVLARTVQNQKDQTTASPVAQAFLPAGAPTFPLAGCSTGGQGSGPECLRHDNGWDVSSPTARRGPGAVASVYVLDSLGSIAGGLLFSFWLVRWLDHFALLAVAALVSLGIALTLAWHLRAWRALAVALGAAVTLMILETCWDVDRWSTARQFPQQRLVFRSNSPYGKLVVTEAAGQLNFLYNGLPLLSSHQREPIEETVHYAMAQRPNARSVLLVGGGISGTAREILRYGVSSVTYVELDPLIIEAGRRFFPQNLADERIRTVTTDGRWFIKNTDQQFDVIILDLPDPSTSQINRLYTAEFFAQAKRILARGGVLALAVGRYANFVSPELARLLSSVHRTLQTAFQHVLVLPGGRVFFLGSDGQLTTDIAGRMAAHGITAQLVNRHYLDAMLAPDRMADMHRATTERAALNEDFNPVLYFYHLVHWASQFELRWSWLGGLGLIGLLVYLSRLRGLGWAILAGGFAASALEVVLLLGFQVLYGSLYRQVGVIVALFMAGSAMGAFVSDRRLGPGRRGRIAGGVPAGAAQPARPRPRSSSSSIETQQSSTRAMDEGRGRRDAEGNSQARTSSGDRTASRLGSRRYEEGRSGSERGSPGRVHLAGIAVAIALFAAVLPLALPGLNRLPPHGILSWAVPGAIPLLTFLLATLVGAEFPLANHLAAPGAATAAPRLYTADFIGASLGALLASAWLIPVLGLTTTCLLTASLNLLGALAAYLCKS